MATGALQEEHGASKFGTLDRPDRRAGVEAVSAAAISWLVLVFGFALPLAHVAFAAKGGPWRPPPGARCPFSPRAGWFVIVLFLGPLGWLLYLRARNRTPS